MTLTTVPKVENGEGRRGTEDEVGSRCLVSIKLLSLRFCFTVKSSRL